MKKTIALVCGSVRTKETLVNQLKEYLDETYDIHGYSIDHDPIQAFQEDLIILSSEFIYSELKNINCISDEMEFIIAKRTINNDYLDQILEIPDNSRVLFVNELSEIVYEVIDHIKEIGIKHIDFVPYYPNIEYVDSSVRLAITPGETHLVPNFIEKVYDIGPRIMDFTTITKILNRLNLLDEKAGQFSLRFLQKTTKISRRLAESKAQISELNKHLAMVIDGLSEGLLVYDSYGVISVLNENLKKLLKSNSVFHVGRNLKEILFNNDLLDFLMDKTDYEEKIFKVNHIEYIVSKIFLNPHMTVAKFRSIKETISESDRIKRELIKKGFFAKYTFENIVGSSETLSKVKSVASKLAKSELTILIYGESGAGKELFASAIHNASHRKDGPYLAVNFSALPDDLIESELFGYEEGAFTGAKKGGKIGLFEQAEGGTIFLDEIGDISLKLQARLLRVLQEKEIMRVGGSEIKPIDVRVIAASNRNLYQLVKENKFREDLFHRLKMGYIKLPPLRERKSDIPSLIKHMLSDFDHEIRITEDVLKKLYQYDWYGNVRELKNTVDYMVAVSDSREITMDHFPEMDFFQNNDKETIQQTTRVHLSPVYQFILKRIQYYNNNDISCGREKLSEDTIGTDYAMTRYQMRTRLNKLCEKGYIRMSKGKKGTEITELGISYLMASGE